MPRLIQELTSSSHRCLLEIIAALSQGGIAVINDARIQDSRRADESKIVIFLVDDEPLLRGIVAGLMHESGHAVLEFGGAAAALKSIHDGARIDLLIADFSMPGLNGVDLIHAAQTARPGLPAILLTGYASNPDPLEMVAAGQGSFEILPKPIDEPVLMRTVATLLRREP